MVRLAPFLSLLSLGIATAVQASLFTVSEPVVVHYEKDIALPSKRHTNAERLAEGLGPAMPRALGGLLPMKSLRERRVKNYRRQATPSGSPAVEPRPSGTGVFSANTDDSSVTLTLPFQAQLFGTSTNTFYVSSNGFITTSSTGASTYANEALPANQVQGAAVFAYWDDLYIGAVSSNTNVRIDVTADRLAVRWQVVRYQTVVPVDVTLVYYASQPGIWRIYYDVLPSVADSATVGVQADINSTPRGALTYNVNVAGGVYEGLILTFTTNPDGSVQTTAR